MTTKDFITLVREQAAAVQAACSSLIDFTVGSILRAIVEANAALVLWLQGLILHILNMTRASTSKDSDLDSWMGDYGVTRIAAKQATGHVTFSRFTPSQQAIIPVGTKCETADGAQVFSVVLDTGNQNYRSDLGGYVIENGVLSVLVPVEASLTGCGGNVAIGGIDTLTSAIPGVDTVTNAEAFTNGTDAEPDDAFRVRFVDYISSLAKATKAAVGYAITSLQAGITYTLVENANYDGTENPGYFYVVVDDGTGNPTQELRDTIYTAIDAVRGITSTFGVFAPVVVTANVVVSISVASGYDATATKALVDSAVRNYINGLGLGKPLRYTRLAQVAYDASAGVTNVTGLTINTATSDITATPKQIIKAGVVTVN